MEERKLRGMMPSPIPHEVHSLLDKLRLHKRCKGIKRSMYTASDSSCANMIV